MKDTSVIWGAFTSGRIVDSVSIFRSQALDRANEINAAGGHADYDRVTLLLSPLRLVAIGALCEFLDASDTAERVGAWKALISACENVQQSERKEVAS